MSYLKKTHLIVAPFPPPIGGVGAAACNLKRLLIDNGVNLECFSTSSGLQHQNLYAKKNLLAYLRNLWLLLKFIGRLLVKSKAKVCHVYTVSNSAFVRDFLLIIIAKLFRKKVIVHLHSKMSGEFFLSKKLLPWFGRMLNCADKVIVLSKAHQHYFKEYINPEKLLVLENFIFSSDFKSATKSTNRFLYVGRLSEKKGFQDLIEAIAICVHQYGLVDIVVDCLGVAESSLRQQEIETKIIQSRISNNIILHGAVLGNKKLQYFRQAGCLIFPSYFENSPIVLKEAIAAGLAITASNIEANKALLDRVGNVVYFDSGDIKALAKNISQLYSNESLQIKLSQKAMQSYQYDEHYAYQVLRNISFSTSEQAVES